MALSVNELQVTWSASNSVSVASSGTQTSDVFTPSSTAFQATIQMKADNGGTPASGDTLDVYLLASLGDPDGASTAEYDTTTQGIFLSRLDTNSDDPAIRTVQLPWPIVSGKIHAVNNGASAITVSAIVLEQTG